MSFRAPLTDHHANGTLCPADHKHTTYGKPIHADCSGRAYTQAVCSCGNWLMKQNGKGYVNECRGRHLADHADGSKAPSRPAPHRRVLTRHHLPGPDRPYRP
ncbi:hypothetical protein [Streptomyces bauhiniae]|uniref:hypothetical protein n=1 Tax=Streptomyces bauhiniae TaxID=2340725 RepID=UPI00364C2C2E